MKQDLLKGLTEDQIAKVKACGSNEEIFELAKKEGITLTDEQLEVVSSGGFLLFNTFKKIELTIKLVNVNKIMVIGPSGAGKSEMSRKLHDILDLPLYHLDNIFWKKDRTHISRDEFDIKLNELLSLDKWIIDGDYSRTYEIRIEKADTIIFLDYPLDTCLQGIESRIGKPRTDIPWKEDIFDPEFKQWIIDWFENTRPRVLSLLEKYKSVKRVVILSSRKEGDEFINSLQQ